MKDIIPGPRTWESTILCGSCSTEATYESDDLQVGGFKANGGFWFDGTATSVDKFFVECPECRATLVIADDDIPLLLRRDVRANRNDGTATRSW